MKKNQLNLFATKSDLENLLQAVESKYPLQFVRTGLFDSPVIEALQSLLDVPDIGKVSVGDAVQAPRYLVAIRTTHVEVETVPQRRGGIKYSVSQKNNPKTVVFSPGGVFAETALIDGAVGTISDDLNSLELFRLFSKEIQGQFKKIREYYVGKEAASLLDKGWRLTHNVRSPILYDLKRVPVRE